MPSPPITIGELTDVPAFNSPIASPWAQEATRRIAHRFASTAERDAKYPAATAGAGALCAVSANPALYVSDGTGWIVLWEKPVGISGAAVSLRWGGNASLPLVWSGALPSTATSAATFARRGWAIDFSITLFSGTAGGLTGAGFVLPYPIYSLAADNVGFTGAWTSAAGQIAPAMFYYNGTAWNPAFYVVATGGAAAIAAVPSGTIPFPPAANAKMSVQGSYITSPAPYG